uniref:Uncharacterized protein n=1 Tax=Anguilla anguilla TaxID=7936 RepID=A0A0E9Q4G2_ANGAN
MPLHFTCSWIIFTNFSKSFVQKVFMRCCPTAHSLNFMKYSFSVSIVASAFSNSTRNIDILGPPFLWLQLSRCTGQHSWIICGCGLVCLFLCGI